MRRPKKVHAPKKVRTIIIDEETYETLVRYSAVDGESIHAFMAQAVIAHVENRKADPQFQEALEKHRQHQERVYARLWHA